MCSRILILYTREDLYFCLQFPPGYKNSGDNCVWVQVIIYSITYLT